MYDVKRGPQKRGMCIKGDPHKRGLCITFCLHVFDFVSDGKRLWDRDVNICGKWMATQGGGDS